MFCLDYTAEAEYFSLTPCSESLKYAEKFSYDILYIYYIYILYDLRHFIYLKT